MTEPEGGRVFFARTRRPPDRATEIRLVSVGVDIGSSTSHLAFSRIVLQRRGHHTQVVRRELLHQSEILLTPYACGESIDTGALGRFFAGQYEQAGIERDMVDTGALILTGVAARKTNARAIGALFAGEAGRFVAVAAGDGLETTLSAQGSGAVAASAHGAGRMMNVDIGGGTSKIAVCEAGRVVDLTALDVGARLVCLDAEGRVVRIEPAGQLFADEAGVVLQIGVAPAEGVLSIMAARMAERLFEACGGTLLSDGTRAFLRLPPMQDAPIPDQLGFSGGVAEYILGRETNGFGDMGQYLADAVAARFRGWGPKERLSDEGIRATVIGASQYSVQLSGNTIFIEPDTSLPLRNLPVIVPIFEWDDEVLDAGAIGRAVGMALRRMGLQDSETPVAVGYRWSGPATHARLDAFCAGVGVGLAPLLERGIPLVLVGEGDVGGLIGLHCRAERHPAQTVISIDGIAAREFDFIDIGEVLQVSGGVPVVVKSLVFPAEEMSAC